MFGAMHFIYYINRSIATKVYYVYMSCGESKLVKSDAFPLHHTCRQNHCNTLCDLQVELIAYF